MPVIVIVDGVFYRANSPGDSVVAVEIWSPSRGRWEEWDELSAENWSHMKTQADGEVYRKE